MTAGSRSQAPTTQTSPSTPPQASSSRSKRGSHILSTVLFIAAIGFAAAAGYLYLQDRTTEEPRVQPTAEPGRNSLGSIVESLKKGGIDADYGRGTGKSDQLSQPGQMITIGDDTLLVFIYLDGDHDAAMKAREADAAKIDTDTMTLTTPSGRDLRGNKAVHISQGSNVIAVLISDDDALATKVQTVIEALP
ncbi:MAG: hypothetical protein ACTHQE_11920 [Thermomicrobiales bacterium]|jgi:hypothetical protein